MTRRAGRFQPGGGNSRPICSNCPRNETGKDREEVQDMSRSHNNRSRGRKTTKLGTIRDGKIVGTMGGIDGVEIPLTGIRMADCHGVTIAGTKVNSPKIGDAGDSHILFERSDGSVTTIGKDDFEVAAVARLRQLGYQVTGTSASA